MKLRAPAGRTVALNVCVAVPLAPPASVAVTVKVAVPSPIGVTVTVLPRTATAATEGAEEATPYVSASPAGSQNAPPTSILTAGSSTAGISGGNAPTGSGGRFGRQHLVRERRQPARGFPEVVRAGVTVGPRHAERPQRVGQLPGDVPRSRRIVHDEQRGGPEALLRVQPARRPDVVLFDHALYRPGPGYRTR